MQIDKQLISRLEDLARLELSDDEREQLRLDLNDILVMVEKLQELNLEGVDPLIHIGDETNQRRPDEIKGQVDLQDALRNAPAANSSYFLVPKVIDIGRQNS